MSDCSPMSSPFPLPEPFEIRLYVEALKTEVEVFSFLREVSAFGEQWEGLVTWLKRSTPARMLVFRCAYGTREEDNEALAGLFAFETTNIGESLNETARREKAAIVLGRRPQELGAFLQMVLKIDVGDAHDIARARNPEIFSVPPTRVQLSRKRKREAKTEVSAASAPKPKKKRVTKKKAAAGTAETTAGPGTGGMVSRADVESLLAKKQQQFQTAMQLQFAAINPTPTPMVPGFQGQMLPSSWSTAAPQFRGHMTDYQVVNGSGAGPAGAYPPVQLQHYGPPHQEAGVGAAIPPNHPPVPPHLPFSQPSYFTNMQPGTHAGTQGLIGGHQMYQAGNENVAGGLGPHALPPTGTPMTPSQQIYPGMVAGGVQGLGAGAQPHMASFSGGGLHYSVPTGVAHTPSSFGTPPQSAVGTTAVESTATGTAPWQSGPPPAGGIYGQATRVPGMVPASMLSNLPGEGRPRGSSGGGPPSSSTGNQR